MDPRSHARHWVDSWHAQPSTNKDYDFIDGLRGIAILMVVACHLIYENRTPYPFITFLYKMISSGSNGVTLFFVLSGFLISWPFWKNKVRGRHPQCPRGYGWRRFYKIYPPLALSILMITPLCVFFTGDHGYYGDAMKYLAGIPLIQPVSGKLNPVMWSLIVEVQFYLIVPLIFFCLSKTSTKVTLWMVFLIFAVIPLAFKIHNHLHRLEFELHPVIQLRFPEKLDAFAPGILMAGLVSSEGISRRWAFLGNWGALLLVAGLAFAAVLKLPHEWSGSFVLNELSSLTFQMAGALLLCYVLNPALWGPRQLSRSLLRWFGIISYEWYLFHQAIWVFVVYHGLGMAGGDYIKYIFIIVTGGGAGLLVAALVYRCFSLPILKWGRDRHAH